MGAFDDLIPSQAGAGAFDDLVPKKKPSTALDTIRTIGTTLSSAIGQGVGGIEAGVGTVLQDPAAAARSGIMGARALIDRGVTSAVNAVSPGAAEVNQDYQEAAQIASRFASERRAASSSQPENIPARLGLMLERDGRRIVQENLENDRANNPELVRQQEAVGAADGFVGTTKALISNPLAFTHTLAKSVPDMVIGLGAGRLAAVGRLADASGAAEAAAALAAKKGLDAAGQAAAAAAAVEAVQASAVARASTAGMLAEGGSSAYQGREGVYQQVATMPLEKLQAAPRFRELLAQTNDPAQAREQLANELADQVPLAAGAGTVVSTLITNRLFGGDATAKSLAGVDKMSVKELGRRIAQDTLEEGLQGVPEDAAQFGATVQADPGQKFDPGGSLAQNLAAGLAMGSGGHGVAFAHQRIAGAPAQAVEASAAPAEANPPAAPAASSQDAMASPGATAAPASAQSIVPTDDAQEALHKRVTLTSLDRVDEIKAEQARAAERLAELSDPAAGYGPMFDEERAGLQRKVDELSAEREALTKDWPKAVMGAPASFSTEAGARVEGQYALMSARDLVTSHDELLKLNSAYPQELQPRDRDRAASEVQVAGIVRRLDPARLALSADAANGAPIVGADGLVESGNARTIAMKRVYQANGQKAEDYKQYLRDNAGQFGLTPEQVDQVDKPVLVRVRSTPVNRAEFARQANASTVAQMSPSEQARSDSNRIDSMDDLQPDENGDFSGAASRPFVRRFMARLPATEQAGMVDASGALSTAGYARVRNAVLAKAYGDSPVLARMTESMDDNLRNVSKALMIAAPRVAQMRQMVGEGARHDADITPDLMAAVEELSRLKDSGTTVEDALAQAGMFGEQYSAETKELLQFLAANLRRPRRMADFLVAYMEALDAAGDPNQGSLLGDVAPPAKSELLSAARRSTDEARTENGTQVPAADAQRGDAGENPAAGSEAGGRPEIEAGSGRGDQGDGAAPGDTRLSRSAETRIKFESRIDELFAGAPAHQKGAVVAEHSSVLGLLGLAKKPIGIAESKVILGKQNHPKITADVWKKAAEWLESPAAAFESASVPGRLVMVAPELLDGSAVLIVVEPAAEGSSKDHLLLNVYDKDGGPPPLAKWVRDGLLRYADQQKFPAVLKGLGLQLPNDAFQNKPGTPKILTQKHLAGYRRSQVSSLSRGIGAGGVPIEDLTALADRIKKGMPNMPKVHVLATPAEAPDALQSYIENQGAWSDVEGAMHDGEFYLFGSGISDLQRAEHVLAEHEAAHFGLRAVLGDSLRSAMNMIYVGNSRVRREASKLQARGRLSNAEATEEVIVDIPSAELAQLKGWRKLVLKVRDHLAARGFEKLPAQLTAWVDGTLDEQQRADLYVAELVRSAREYMAGKRSGQPSGFMGVTRLSGTLSEDVAAQEKWLAAEAKARGFYDIEHMLDKDPALFEKLAELWRKKHPADSLLSRAPGASGPKTAAERADDVINKRARTAAPVDAVAKAVTKLTGLEKLTTAIYDKAGYILDRYTPEHVKAGLVSDYGVPEAVIDQRAMLQGRQRVQLRQAGHLIDALSTLTRAESRVAYEWMNMDGKDPRAYVSMMQGLPEESVKVLQDVQKLIDRLSREAVHLGQLTPEAYERNKFAYLRRSYIKHTLEQTPGEKKARARAISILGDQYKGRGLTEEASMKQIQNAAPEWWGRKLKDGKADTALKGQEFLRLERRTTEEDNTKVRRYKNGKTKVLGGTREVMANPGAAQFAEMEKSEQPTRLREVVYVPAGEAIPAQYSEWVKAGTFEVRDVKGDKAVMWRDFTKEEREQMGEIDEARFAIAKTLHAMIHDVEVGRYLEWLSQNYAKKDGGAVAGKVVEASERYRDTFAPGEWVQVPDTKIAGTAVQKYGKLAGLYLPGPIWNDLRQVVNGQAKPLGETYAKILGAWKSAKTALSPAVHVNNVMSNFVMADWHDVTAGHVAKALRILMGAHQRDGKGIIGTVGNQVARLGMDDREAAREVLNRYLDSGGDIGGWATNEIAKDQIAPLLEAMEKELQATGGQSAQAQMGIMSALQHALHLRFPDAIESLKGSKPGKAASTEVQNLLDLYQSEDDVFRLAAWLRAKEEGASDLAAGKVARRSFLDYRVNAPWIQAMRTTAWPFISFTYRAVPMLLETAAKKPHKLLKLMVLAGGLNALGVLLAGGGDDERRLLPEEKAGSIWGMVPKLVRMPWNDAQGSPVYLDIRRFIPVGDVFDIGQGHSAIPMLPYMQPGGPLALIGEIFLNRSMFTGQSITLETDTAAQKAFKFSDYLFKAFAPNVLIPNPVGYLGEAVGAPKGWLQTYSSTGVGDAINGRADSFGREQSVGQSVASSFGVKLGSYPPDVLRLNLLRKAQAEIMEIDRNIATLKRQRHTNRLSQEDFLAAKNVEQAKKKAIAKEVQGKISQSSGISLFPSQDIED